MLASEGELVGGVCGHRELPTTGDRVVSKDYHAVA